MNINHTTLATFLASVAFATVLPASASGWKTWKGMDEAAPRAVLTDTTDRAGAVLVCDATGKMSAIVSLTTDSISDQLDMHATYKRGETAVISSGQEDPIETTVRYSPANKIIEIGAHTPAARIYNSVIRGNTISIAVEHADQVTTTLPAPDATFKAFAKTCMSARTKADN